MVLSSVAAVAEALDRVDDSKKLSAIRREKVYEEIMKTALYVGIWHEVRAAGVVLRRGYRLLAWRYRAGKGEIDLIARDKSTIVFVEVKARVKQSRGAGIDAVTADKRRRMRSAANVYLKHKGLLDAACRFDIVKFTKDDVFYVESAF